MNLSALKKFSSKNSGFTLIELLVVIGILGILAAALVATIDPFEQLKKAGDSNRKNAAVEFQNAVIRYYTTHSAFPWDTIANSGANCNSAGTAPVDDPSGVALNTWLSSGECVDVLVDEGELKSGFSTSQILDDIFVSEATNDVVVCYLPESKSGRREPNTIYTSSGAPVANPTTSCVGYGGATACYWCTR